MCVPAATRCTQAVSACMQARALLREYPGTFRLRHCLSSPVEGAGLEALKASKVEGEKMTRGRVDHKAPDTPCGQDATPCGRAATPCSPAATPCGQAAAAGVQAAALCPAPTLQPCTQAATLCTQVLAQEFGGAWKDGQPAEHFLMIGTSEMVRTL